MANDLPGTSSSASTAKRRYTERVNRLQGKRWKEVLRVQLPWELHFRSMNLGRVLDIGCGNGRVLRWLAKGSIGVDHNSFSVQTARDRGLEAHTVKAFFADDSLARAASYDALLASHLLEHLSEEDARKLMAAYLPMLKPGGRFIGVCPQERGFDSDPTHCRFVGFEKLRQLSADLGLLTTRQYSFPLPRFFGPLFIYNEFVHVARLP